MNPTELNILYTSVFPKFKNWIVHNSGSTEDAHDTFQEVLEVVLIKENMDGITIKTSIEAYIFRACKYRWIDKLRKNKRRGEVISLDVSRHNIGSDFHEEMMALEEENQKYELLDRTFLLLSELCQKILSLLKEGKKPIEIVEIIGASGVSTINRRKFACMEAWKKHVAIEKISHSE